MFKINLKYYSKLLLIHLFVRGHRWEYEVKEAQKRRAQEIKELKERLYWESLKDNDY